MLYKKIRHSYWLLTGFVHKHMMLLIVSSIGTFLLILFLINFFPFFNAFLFRQNKVIGLIGRYSLNTIPDSIRREISNPLITIDQKGEIQPLLAYSWEVLDGGRRYRFHLRNDLFWTDKNPFTAQDIQYSFVDVKIKTIDDYTIDFILKEPLNIFPIYLTQPVIKPPLTGVGSLYTVDSYKIRKNELKKLTLSPNKPELPSKSYVFYDTEEKLVTGFKRGDITYFQTASRTVADTFSPWKNTNVTKSLDYNKVMVLFLNTKSGPLQERDVRKGIAYGTPSFPDLGEKAKSPIPPVSWAYHDDIKEYPFNEERAKTLIEKNLSASSSAKLTLYTFFDYLEIAQTLKKSYENLGLSIQLKIVSSPPDSTDPFDMFLTVWNPPADPDQYFFWHSTQVNTNITHLNNPKIDKLLEDGRRVVNVKQRQAIYADFQKNIAEEVPAYFMYHPYMYTIDRR